MRFATDTGGTFTDLVVEDDQKRLFIYKASTTPDDPVQGVLSALQVAAEDRGCSLHDLMEQGELFIHGTTHALNATVTNHTANTALLTTRGHPDVLVLREGGRTEPFNHTVPYPEPYIPRSLTHEVDERTDSNGTISTRLNEEALLETLAVLKQQQVEAIAVCLLWSVVNPTHELRIGELIDQHLPGIPYTLSHQLNPVMREYRRASATAIDASLKPLMTRYIGGLTSRLTDAGFRGRILVLTSQGGMMDADYLAHSPIHLLNSGPSMAPVAGRYYGRKESRDGDIIIADTGGTTYDVSLVRNNRIPLSREMWVGNEYTGHMTGFPSIDVKSVGAGGGSIAWVDKGGVLHVGPRSQGSDPGPACYGRGGDKPTVTDATVVLGYLDPDFFLGGKMKLDGEASFRVIEDNIAKKLGLSVHQAAAAVISIATENMVQAIVDIAVNQGVNPASSVLIGGGGAAGLNSTFIAQRLGCKQLVIPEVGATLSAAGAIMSELTSDYRKALFLSTDNFDRDKANRVLGELKQQCVKFIEEAGEGSLEQRILFTVEARYKNQVWQIDVPLEIESFDSEEDIEDLVKGFHREHQSLFAVCDPQSPVEIVNWCASVHCRLRDTEIGRISSNNRLVRDTHVRQAYFAGRGFMETSVMAFDNLPENTLHKGPAIVESPFTTVVVDPDSQFERTASGSLVLKPSSVKAG